MKLHSGSGIPKYVKEIDKGRALAGQAALELTPLFANYGLTENAIVAAGILVASGLPVLPALTATAIAGSYLLDKIRYQKSLAQA